MPLAFRQVDVFSGTATGGNPVAVVHGGDGLTDEQMAAFARWTNLSETTFLLAPTDPAADYRLRIWTPGGELPFAGHPTLGSAHAWLEAGGTPAGQDVVQECGVGLVRLRRLTVPDPRGPREVPQRSEDTSWGEGGGTRLAFAGPPLLRSGEAGPEVVEQVARALRLPVDEILAAEWIDNGPGWIGVRLRDAAAVLELRPDFAAFGELKIGVVGRHTAADRERLGADVEVRAFVPALAVPEDPVTGSLNAGLAEWLAGGELPARYVAAQGTVLGRRGRVYLEKTEDGTVWVAGDTVTTVQGTVSL
ncbi:PhzF family phenazine biosynthesis protein [Antribacter sp. KLBMP9083]|uniref:PhzF family phenazine biosynthesis protein n=1 Tax=Antribacter soli TaxID=2910976 RepID=A0AA41QE31_9MICO|nr:PhzF family phenazine biosynthesis protein [Antribacter soli]MCF4121780.1 PhzF family phenazine biosynthesis protein [Antribacter soli]